MHYDTDNNKFVSLDGEMEIYPDAENFFESSGITLEFGRVYIDIPTHRFDELMEGLRMAKRKISGE